MNPDTPTPALEQLAGPGLGTVKPGRVKKYGSQLLQRSRLWAFLYLLMVPTVVGTLLFTYYPNMEAVKYAFYRWDGSQIEEFRGLQNFRTAFTADPLFWSTFNLVFILLIANLIKMWPSIFVAIAIHRLKSERAQFMYRVLFVIPMVIPGLVWLLIWKTFFTEGMLNQILSMTGMMSVLNVLDSPEHGLPALAAFTAKTAYAWNPDHPLLSALASPLRLVPMVFGGSWGLALFGIALLIGNGGTKTFQRRWLLWALLAGVGYWLWGPVRLPILALLAIAVPEAWQRRNHIDSTTYVRWLGIGCVAAASLIILLTEIWTDPVNGWEAKVSPFADGLPPWLGNSKLVIPAIIFWGFPWVGTIGVLIYLAGLQNISQEVYEAAELDGVGSWGKIFRIELPLIMSQVRINLIFMTIGTLTDYALLLILLGANGGPDNRGMVPGLYMYKKAFLDGEFGYACTLGVIMFLIVLGLTFLYQRFVKVDK